MERETDSIKQESEEYNGKGDGAGSFENMDGDAPRIRKTPQIGYMSFFSYIIT